MESRERKKFGRSKAIYYIKRISTMRRYAYKRQLEKRKRELT